MDQTEFQKILKKYLSRDASESERSLIEGWYLRIGSTDLVDIELSEAMEKEIFKEIRNKISESKQNLE
jgi:hypothetical protein